MKKNYIAPATEVMNVEMESMIAASIENIWGDSGRGFGNDEPAPPVADSKDHGFDLWGLDED